MCFSLSKIAGSKLTDGNANIADLSDPNRPTKLAEQFGQIYDNEWTDAFDYKTTVSKRNDVEAIAELLSILQVKLDNVCPTPSTLTGNIYQNDEMEFT